MQFQSISMCYHLFNFFCLLPNALQVFFLNAIPPEICYYIVISVLHTGLVWECSVRVLFDGSKKARRDSRMMRCSIIVKLRGEPFDVSQGDHYANCV